MANENNLHGRRRYRGKKCRRCEDCVKTEILKAVGHKFTDSYFIATCEEEGYSLHICLSCGNEYKDNKNLFKINCFEAGIETDCGCESAEGKIENFLLQEMAFTEHCIDRDAISQFLDTVIPRTETCYEWYMDFDLVLKAKDEKKMVWGFTINYNEARGYRSE